MENERLEKVLQDIGLSEGEARLYLVMLANGPSPVLRLARLSGLKRTTIYSLMDRLKELGIARVDVQGFKRLFVAEPPSHLDAVLATRKNLLEKHLPELEKLVQSDGGVSFLKYYEGLNAVRGVYENLLASIKSKDDYLVLSNQEEWEALDTEYFPRFQERRGKLPINIRLILQDTPSARHSYEFQKNINARIKLLPKETVLTTNLIVVPDRVVIHQLKPPTLAIVIENQSVIQMH